MRILASLGALALVVPALVALSAGRGAAADIKVLTGGAYKPVILALTPAFERATGHRLLVANDTVGALAKRITDGESFDAVVLTPALVREFTSSGRLLVGSGRDVARVGIGVAVAADAPSPDISTVESFKAAIAAASSVAYIDPASGGSSGVYLAGLFKRLGITDEVARKAVLVPGGLVAERVARGEAALAIHQVSEILPVKGVRLVGLLPDSIQNYTIYTAAAGAGARDPEAARAFVSALSGPEAAAVLADKGMQPIKEGARAGTP